MALKVYAKSDMTNPTNHWQQKMPMRLGKLVGINIQVQNVPQKLDVMQKSSKSFLVFSSTTARSLVNWSSAYKFRENQIDVRWRRDCYFRGHLWFR